MTHIPDLVDALFPVKGDSLAPMLRMFDVSVDWFDEIVKEDIVVQMAAFYHPTLQRLAWRGNTLPLDHLNTSMWRTLQQLTFSYVSSYDLLTFLEACPDITSIKIGTLITATMNGPVLAPKLQTLCIQESHGDVSYSLEHIIAPQLKTLRYTENIWGYYDAAGHIAAFLAKCECRLSLLDINITHPFEEYGMRWFLDTDPIPDIPNVVLRIHDLASPERTISEMLSGCRFHHTQPHVFSHLEPDGGCRLGWGNCDIQAFNYARYPFSL